MLHGRLLVWVQNDDAEMGRHPLVRAARTRGFNYEQKRYVRNGVNFGPSDGSTGRDLGEGDVPNLSMYGDARAWADSASLW
jgi:hypothetical protein